jgi:hypothetical protein
MKKPGAEAWFRGQERRRRAAQVVNAIQYVRHLLDTYLPDVEVSQRGLQIVVNRCDLRVLRAKKAEIDKLAAKTEWLFYGQVHDEARPCGRCSGRFHVLAEPRDTDVFAGHGEAICRPCVEQVIQNAQRAEVAQI